LFHGYFLAKKRKKAGNFPAFFHKHLLILKNILDNSENLSFPVKKGENVFELPSFSKQGIYFISVQKNAQKQIFKFVKE